MDVHAKFNIQQAFVAKNDDIVKIWKMLEKEGMEVTATISCSDDFVRTFQNNESLIEYENSKRASITTLEIKARLADKPYSSSRAEITMKSDKFFSAAPISVSISGDENLVLPMRTKITDILHGMKPWYSWIATIELFYVGILIFMSLSLLLLFMSPPSNMPTPALPLDKALVRLVVDAAVIGGFCGFIWE